MERNNLVAIQHNRVLVSEINLKIEKKKLELYTLRREISTEPYNKDILTDKAEDIVDEIIKLEDLKQGYEAMIESLK